MGLLLNRRALLGLDFFERFILGFHAVCLCLCRQQTRARRWRPRYRSHTGQRRAHLSNEMNDCGREIDVLKQLATESRGPT